MEDLEHGIQPWVAYGVLPIFAFANAGVALGMITMDSILQTVPLGIAAGLFFGKQIGVFGASFLAVKLGLAKLPDKVSWLQIYGVALLCGIGFTMSLFIGSLAFDYSSGEVKPFDERIGILIGSLLSAIAGTLVLRFASKAQPD